MAKEKYNFEFITLALGLVPIQAGVAAINPGAITSLQIDTASGKWVMHMHGGTEYVMTAEDLAELEETIKRRGEEAKAIQKEAMRNQMLTQQEVISELNSGIEAGRIIGAIPRRGRN